MHPAYNNLLDVLSYSISTYVNLIMSAIYNLFQIILLETDSNGNVIGFNFLGTCIILILGLYIIVWFIVWLVSLFAFDQSKEDIPQFDEIQKLSNIEGTIYNTAMKSGEYSYKSRTAKNKLKFAYYKTKENIYDKKVNKAIKTYNITENKALKQWKKQRDLEKFRKYRNKKK